jgi:polyisoprenyl-phosphate glycosyltransferase
LQRDNAQARRDPRISVAIPVFNEETVLPELYRRLVAVLEDLPGGPHEIVFVDDGSSDGTWEILETLAAINPQVQAVSLSRNFGHQAALSAALDHVTGDVVVAMDGDLQDTPESIPLFLDEYARGADVVYAIRRDRKEHWLLRFCYDAFYRVIAALADIPLPIGAGDFGLMSRRVVDVLRRSEERHRYLRGLRTWAGFRQVGVSVERAQRHSGKSKYSLRKLLMLAGDGIFSFSVVPLRAAAFLGALAIVASMLFGVYSLVAKFVLRQSPSGFTALYISMAFFAGVQLVFLGVIGEYVGRIYEEVKRRPVYLVDQVLNAPTRAAGALAGHNRTSLPTAQSARGGTPLMTVAEHHEP